MKPKEERPASTEQPHQSVGAAVQSLAGQLEEAFSSVGASLMPAEFAAKLLAYLYVMGGGNEAVTLNAALNAGLRIAQEKFKLKGGEAPDRTGIVLIKKYIAELERSYDPDQGYQAEWLDEISIRYSIKIKRLCTTYKKKDIYSETIMRY